MTRYRIEDHGYEDHGYTSPCWIWSTPNQAGYATMQLFTREVKVHRLMWQIKEGPIAEGLHLHHKCHQPACINPDHLEVMTASEHRTHHNLMRSAQPKHITCRHGHEYTTENTVFYDGLRKCRQCRKNADERAYLKKRAKRLDGEL